MPNFIDRRLNPKGKSLGNRQRFMKRARAQIKRAVDQAIKGRNIADVERGETVTIPTRGIDEPRFHHERTGGERERVFTGNKGFVAGDRIAKPKQDGEGSGGKRASDQGQGEDEFRFALSRDEFLDLFFENLELPDLVKTSLNELYAFKPRRAGFAVSGTPTNINILRTMRNSFGRRLALKRPKEGEAEALQREILRLEAEVRSNPSSGEVHRLAALREELEKMRRKRRTVPYIDPVDIRYNRYEAQPLPNTKAVMFCLMDVSGSMGEREKDLAKRFFVLLHLFLKRRYERIDIVFVRHTHEAQEVDEETFFYGRETGGTVVSTALKEMLRVVRDRYPTNDWNIYAAQASDGDNFSGDSAQCLELLDGELMPLCQYYAYVEILDEREIDIFHEAGNGTSLWRTYQEANGRWPNFQMKRIARPSDIYPVFHELFAKQPKQSKLPAPANA